MIHDRFVAELPPEAYLDIRTRLARKAGRFRVPFWRVSRIAHVLLVSLTIHEMTFPRKA